MSRVYREVEATRPLTEIGIVECLRVSADGLYGDIYPISNGATFGVKAAKADSGGVVCYVIMHYTSRDGRRFRQAMVVDLSRGEIALSTSGGHRAGCARLSPQQSRTLARLVEASQRAGIEGG